MSLSQKFYPGMICWRCQVTKHGTNLVNNMLTTKTLPKTYSMVLVSGSMELDVSDFLRKVSEYENYGVVIDSFTCFCDNCRKITMHTEEVNDGHCAEEVLMYSIQYMQNELCEMDSLKKFRLLPVVSQ
jgi:hypothetical protein